MNTNKLLAALNYFSIFFAGIIFPIVVYLVSEDRNVKNHAKKALISHLIMLIPIPFIIYGIFTGAADAVSLFFIVSIAVFIVLNLVIIIWNLVNGIKVIARDEFS